MHLKTGLYKEGIQEAKEASGIFERLGHTVGQGLCLISLAWAFNYDKQLDAAEEAALRAIKLFSEEDQQFNICLSHHILGVIYSSKGEAERAINHLEAALKIASSYNWFDQLFLARHSLAQLFSEQGKLDDANTQIEHAKSHAVGHRDTYFLARAMEQQAGVWYKQHRFEEARSEALRAVEAFQKLGAADDAKRARILLQQINHDARANMGNHELGDNGEPLKAAPLARVY